MVETDTIFYKTLVENFTDVITIIDASGVILYQNSGAKTVLNQEPEEMKGRSIFDYLHPQDVGSFRQLLAFSGRWKESPFTSRLRFRQNNGSWVLAESRGMTMTDNPVVQGIVIVSRNVSGSEPAGRGVESKLKAIAESTYHAIVAIDQSSTIVFANPATEQLFGYDPTELIDKSLDILIPGHLRPHHHRGMGHYAETGIRKASWTGRETYGLHKSGREVPIQISYQEFYEGNNRYFAGIIEDITARKRTEQQLMTQYAVTRVLAGSWNLNETIPHMLKAIGAGLGFDVAELWLLANGALARSGEWHLPAPGIEEFRDSAQHTEVPVGQGVIGRVIASGESRWVSHLMGDPVFSRARYARKAQVQTGIFVPIHSQIKKVGVLALFSRSSVPHDPDLVQFLEILGGQIGDLLERKRGEEERANLLVREQAARAAAQESERRLAFQADASLILSSSLDYFGSLSQIARLAVPRVADWCAVDVMDDNRIPQRVTLVHRDPGMAELARELRLRYPPSRHSRHGVLEVIKTGKSRLVPEFNDNLIRQYSQDQQHYEILKEFGLRSLMIVPLPIRGQSLGAITFATGGSGRTYTISDLAFAEDLARRSAIAIDNSRLYQKAQDSLNDIKAKAAEIEKLNAELEHRVQERTAQLEAANRELEAFAYSVSHDLRAPIRSMHGFTQIIREDHADKLTAEGRRLLGIVQQSADKMGHLIDDLLRFSRMGRQAMQHVLIDMTLLARNVFDDLAKSEGPRSIHFSVEDLPPAMGDHAMIRQVFTNLLSNAIKFSPKHQHATINVTGRELTTFNEYTVKDNGVGFNMEFKHKLFGVFQRLHSDEEFPGTGVGLALVQRIIHRHGGSITGHSVPGRETAFTFTLPKGESPS